MQNNLRTLLESLQNERVLLESEKRRLTAQGTILRQSRQTAARNCLEKLVPNLKIGTMEKLITQVPTFIVPSVSRFFGLSWKVDPRVTIDSLRIQLGNHLDTTDCDVPQAWENEVRSIDASIRDLQENLIRSNAERIADISERIEAVEKLLSVDTTKMEPRFRERFNQAVRSQLENRRGSTARTNSFARTRSNLRESTPYPTQTQIDSDSGPSLLEQWLWYQVLTSHSECSHEVRRIESGGGSSAGAGATSNWDDQTNQVNTVPFGSSFTRETAPLAAFADTGSATEEAQLATHASLGSQSFS